MYGTNDDKSPQAVTAAMENLAHVIDACAKRGAVPVLATIPPRGYSKEKQDGQKRFNEALIKLCREKKVPISYCYEEMMTHDLRKMLSDGVHLTPGPGNDAAGRALLKTFRQVYWALRDKSDSWD
jgi:lysophospholipase L1-like esterase